MSDERLHCLRLVDGEERDTLTIGSTEIDYAILSHGELRALAAEHTTRGVLDVKAHDDALWQRIILGWRNLFGGPAGEPVAIEFDPARILEVVAMLPPDLARALESAARAPQWAVHDALGN